MKERVFILKQLKKSFQNENLISDKWFFLMCNSLIKWKNEFSFWNHFQSEKHVSDRCFSLPFHSLSKWSNEFSFSKNNNIFFQNQKWTSDMQIPRVSIHCESTFHPGCELTSGSVNHQCLIQNHLCSGINWIKEQSLLWLMKQAKIFFGTISYSKGKELGNSLLTLSNSSSDTIQTSKLYTFTSTMNWMIDGFGGGSTRTIKHTRKKTLLQMQKQVPQKKPPKINHKIKSRGFPLVKKANSVERFVSRQKKVHHFLRRCRCQNRNLRFPHWNLNQDSWIQEERAKNIEVFV